MRNYTAGSGIEDKYYGSIRERYRVFTLPIMSGLLINAVVAQLNQYIKSVEDGPSEASIARAVLGNMAKTIIAGGNDSELEERVVVSLVNVAEEGTLKNISAVRQVDSESIKFQPPVHANLYLLFASNFSDYSSAIDYLLRVIEFFQGKKIFNFKNSPLASADPTSMQGKADTEISIDLHTLSFEQLNDLWGSLGSKQVPFVLYRARLIAVQMELPVTRSGRITDIGLTTHNK